MKRVYRYQLEKLVSRYEQLKEHDHTLYRGYCLSAHATGWIIRPFGQNEIFLGETLAIAYETLQQMVDALEDQAESFTYNDIMALNLYIEEQCYNVVKDSILGMCSYGEELLQVKAQLARGKEIWDKGYDLAFGRRFDATLPPPKNEKINEYALISARVDAGYIAYSTAHRVAYIIPMTYVATAHRHGYGTGTSKVAKTKQKFS